MAERLLQKRKQIQLLRKPERLKCWQIFPYKIYLFWHWMRCWLTYTKPVFTAGAIHARSACRGQWGKLWCNWGALDGYSRCRTESLSQKKQPAAAPLASEQHLISLEIVFHRVEEIPRWDCQQPSSPLLRYHFSTTLALNRQQITGVCWKKTQSCEFLGRHLLCTAPTAASIRF